MEGFIPVLFTAVRAEEEVPTCARCTRRQCLGMPGTHVPMSLSRNPTVTPKPKRLPVSVDYCSEMSRNVSMKEISIHICILSILPNIYVMLQKCLPSTETLNPHNKTGRTPFHRGN